MREARSRTGGARLEFVKISRMVVSERCFCWSSVSTRTYVAAKPFFQTFSLVNVQPGTCRDFNSARSKSAEHPASMSAPSVMSPLIPEKQSKYASFMGSFVAREVCTADEVRKRLVDSNDGAKRCQTSAIYASCGIRAPCALRRGAGCQFLFPLARRR
jgi:hypothetical protein